MAKIVSDLITDKGIKICDIEGKSSFSQFIIDGIIELDCTNQSIEYIINVSTQGCILNYEVVKTPVGISQEGQNLTGYKLVVCGDINTKIKYEDGSCSEPINTINYNIPFCQYIVLPDKFDSNCSIVPSVYIQDISLRQISGTSIYYSIMILAMVDLC